MPRAVTMSIVIALVLAVLTSADEPSYEGLSGRGQLSTVGASVANTEPSTQELATIFEREATLSKLAPAAGAPSYRRFLWHFLAAEERSAVELALSEKPTRRGGGKIQALLAGPDQFRYDRSFRYTTALRSSILAATNLDRGVFTSSGRCPISPAC